MNSRKQARCAPVYTPCANNRKCPLTHAHATRASASLWAPEINMQRIAFNHNRGALANKEPTDNPHGNGHTCNQLTASRGGFLPSYPKHKMTDWIRLFVSHQHDTGYARRLCYGHGIYLLTSCSEAQDRERIFMKFTGTLNVISGSEMLFESAFCGLTRCLGARNQVESVCPIPSYVVSD